MEQTATTRATFSGTASKFFGIVWRGGLLQLPTFGFYRFWLITDARRYLWSNTRFGDDGLEYTGQARQILIGFLIAVGILLPIYLAYFLLGIEAERIQAFASLPLALIFYALYQYASYRARSYRLSHTSFRGLRFSMTGSGWGYAARAIVWDILTALSLGLALPWRQAALERYRMSHTQFGSLNGNFAATGGQLFARGWGLWLFGVAGFGALIAAGGIVIITEIEKQSAGQPPSFAGGLVPLVSFLFISGYFLIVMPLYKAIELRWRLGGMRMGDAALASDLPKGRIVGAYLKATAAILALLIVFGVGVGGFFMTVGPSMVQLNVGEVPLGLMIAFSLLYLLFLVVCNILLLRFVTYNIWTAAVASLTVANIAALEMAAAAGASVDQTGDGIADAFDFGGIGV